MREEICFIIKNIQRTFITQLETKRRNSSGIAIIMLICVDIDNPDRIAQNDCAFLV